MQLEAAFAQSLAPGESVCGDGHFVAHRPGEALVAVVDGLGHGPKAHLAATRLIEAIAADPWRPLERLLRAGAQALVGTRGCAVSLLSVSGLTCRFAGLGNVRVHSLNTPDFRPFPLPGVLSAGRAPAVKVFEGQARPGATFAICSDGIDDVLRLASDHALLAPAALARRILEAGRRGDDDATVAVARLVQSAVTD